MVSFNFSFQPGMSLQQMIGFEIAGRVWSSYLTDNATVNIHIGTSSSLSPTVLGGALPGFRTSLPYNDLRNTLIPNDATSAVDQAARNSFLYSQQFWTDFYQYNTSGSVVYTHTTKVDNVSLTRANAKALGTWVDQTTSTLDGYIVINNQVKNSAGQSIPWNYNYTSTSAPSNTVDFVSVAIHEIGHILGFVSAVDRSWEVPLTSTDFGALLSSFSERANEITPLDLFRFVNSSSTTSGAMANSAEGGTPYFLLNVQNLGSVLGYFGTGKNTTFGGSGFQASHWSGNTGSSGMMNASLGTGQRARFAEIDLQAFDAIGWNRSTATASTTLNWSTLQSQAKQALANRIGRTVTWIDANQTTAADLLDQDRLGEVNLMLSSSADVYEGRRNTTTGSWQELFSLLDEQGLMDTLEGASSQLAKATVRNDLLAGSTTDDELSGLRGNDQMIGFKGNDTLRGNKGVDTLLGSLGQDILIGGKGDDTLIGGAGADVFAVQRNFGFDVVEDFTDGQDKLVLLGGLQFEQLGIQQKGQDTLISFEGKDLMQLKNLDAALLTRADIVAAI